MSRDDLARRGCRLFDRRSQSSSAAGLAARLVPQRAERALAIGDRALGAVIVAMVWYECRDCNVR